ncbi:hypothetical protein [Ruegeria sp.]|uniref:hypothetical protein n=1 Tax=Ruegeria sp. TaxID=1879320 RepID=UPI003B5A5B16
MNTAIGSTLSGLAQRLINLPATVIYFGYFGLLSLMTSRAIIQSMAEIPSYHMTDWGINYAGGFVRRGFIGEILLYLSRTFGWDFATMVTSLAVVTSMAFLYFAARLFYPLRGNHWAWFLIYAPFGFVAPVLNDNIAGHKDSLLLCLAGILFFVSATWPQGKKREVAIYVLLLLTAPLLLIHEGYVIFLPVLFVALTTLPLTIRVFAIGILIGLIDLAVFLYSVTHAGDIVQRDAMMSAFYSEMPLAWALRPLDEYVAFFYIGQNFVEAQWFVGPRAYGGASQLPAALIMIVGPLLVFACKIGMRRVFQNWSVMGIIAATLVTFSIVAQVLIFPIILDWTRFLSLYLMVCSLALVTRVWASDPGWSQLPGVATYDNGITRYTLAWFLFASMFFLKPGKVAPDIIKFDAGDVFTVAMITFAIFAGCVLGRRTATAPGSGGKDAV